MFEIINKGQALVSTNYWTSEHAEAGYCYLTWNAGAARILIPDAVRHLLREMKGAREVIISRGPWTDQGGGITVIAYTRGGEKGRWPARCHRKSFSTTVNTSTCVNKPSTC